ncbi:MAG: hypothetical protein ACJ72S_17435 [Nitrososphaeraceae archaeon]
MISDSDLGGSPPSILCIVLKVIPLPLKVVRSLVLTCALYGAITEILEALIPSLRNS